MTSLTGKTEAVCAPTRDPPSFGLAMFGAVAQLGALGYVWATQTSALACVAAPRACAPRSAARAQPNFGMDRCF